MNYCEVYTIRVEGVTGTREYRLVAPNLKEALALAERESPGRKIYAIEYEGTVLV